jgi:protocatechuate 3,4-dioxygenase beta subunit
MATKEDPTIVRAEESTASATSRREFALGALGGAATLFLAGCGDASEGGSESDAVSISEDLAAAAEVAPTCVVRPQQTEGPYFVDEKLLRSDIRTDPTDGRTKAGAPLSLTFRVGRIAGATCSALGGVLVDVWQTDALGVYSDVRDRGGAFDTRGKKFLRGYQTTNAGGIAAFTTIYPGWYPGRTVHIHFKIRTAPGAVRGYEYTSQLYFDDALTDQVHATAPYNTKGSRTTRNAQDGIYRSGGSKLKLQVTKVGTVYAATFDIGLSFA